MEREEILQTLRRDVEAAKDKLASEIEELDAIVRESRSALLQPDGAQRIRSAAEALSVARNALETLERLNTFAGEGVDNLKESADREERSGHVKKQDGP